MRALLVIILLALSFSASAQMRVQVVSTTDDQVGKRLVYALKEQIRQSTSLQISLDDSELGMQANLVTLEQYPDSPGTATVYSLVLTWNNPEQPFPFMLTQYTGYCGSSRVESCAKTLVAEISDQSDKLMQLFIKASKR